MGDSNLDVSTIQVATDIITTSSANKKPQYHGTYADLGYTSTLTSDLVTVSLGDVHNSAQIGGVLYIPTLTGNSACTSALDAVLVPNVPRLADLPKPGREILLALTPWIHEHNCGHALVAQANRDGAKGFITFEPKNSSQAPPSYSNDYWFHHEGQGAEKQTSGSKIPVVAIPGQIGYKLLAASAAYNNPISQVPNGRTLEGYYGQSATARLVAQITMGHSSSQLPSLWILLLGVLGIVLLLMGSTSVIMHWIQRRRRNNLRTRVANGEVDLEALGIKRLVVPQEVLEKMPLYIYGSGEVVERLPSEAQQEVSADEASGKDIEVAGVDAAAAHVENEAASEAKREKHHRWGVRRHPVSTAGLPTPKAHAPSTLQQPTCPICLEDFVRPSSVDATTAAAGEIPATAPTTTIPETMDVKSDTMHPDTASTNSTPPAPALTTTTSNPSNNPTATTGTINGGTIVRELPCRHIFHPLCIDSFLTSTSSLCPMCKTAALPKGYCPEILTNAMVRRERLMRRGGINAVSDSERRVSTLGVVGLERWLPGQRQQGGQRGSVASQSQTQAPPGGAGVARDHGAGNEGSVQRSRSVAWGGGMANLPPYYERQRFAARRRTSQLQGAHNPEQGQEMLPVAPISENATTRPAPTATVAEADGEAATPEVLAGRREWARQRATAMLGARRAPLDPDAEEERTLPAWRRGVMRVFPHAAGR